MVDRFGPRRLMLVGIVMAGLALVGLVVCDHARRLLPVLRVQRARLRVRRAAAEPGAALAMVRQGPRQGDGHSPISASASAARVVPLLAYALTQTLRLARRHVVARHADDRRGAAGCVFRAASRRPLAADRPRAAARALARRRSSSRPAFFLLLVGSMASIGAVGGTMQNLALYLSLDRKLAQGDVDATLSLVLIGSLVGQAAHGMARRSRGARSA